MKAAGAWRLPEPRPDRRGWLALALGLSMAAHLGGMGWMLWQPPPRLPDAAEAPGVEMRWHEASQDEKAAPPTGAAPMPAAMETAAMNPGASPVEQPLPASGDGDDTAPSPPETAENPPIPAAEELPAEAALPLPPPPAAAQAPAPRASSAAASPEAAAASRRITPEPQARGEAIGRPRPAPAQTTPEPVKNAEAAARALAPEARPASAPQPDRPGAAPIGEVRLAALRTPECLVPVTYPEQAREAGWAGRVLLKMRVSNDGRTVFVEVQESSGWAVLDEAARLAAKRCRFEPALRDGRAVWSTVRLPITFSL